MSEAPFLFQLPIFRRNFASGKVALILHTIELSETAFFILQKPFLQNFANNILAKCCSLQNFAHIWFLITGDESARLRPEDAEPGRAGACVRHIVRRRPALPLQDFLRYLRSKQSLDGHDCSSTSQGHSGHLK